MAGMAHLVAILLWAAPSVGYAEPSMALSNEPLNFSVIRQGEKIGIHRIEFRKAGDLLYVDIRVRIAVQILFITVFRFEHDAQEVWRNGRFVSMRSKTHDDGKDHVLEAAVGYAREIKVVEDGQTRTIPGNMIPGSFWNASFLKMKAIINPLVGTPDAITVVHKGEETVSVRGKPVRARHYSITGDVSRELWYDANWNLVQFSLVGKDGSEVQYLLL